MWYSVNVSYSEPRSSLVFLWASLKWLSLQIDLGRLGFPQLVAVDGVVGIFFSF